MRGRDITDYGLLSVVWGISFAVLLQVVRAFGWAGAVAFRALIAGTILLVIAAVTRRKLDFSAGWRPFAVVGATTVAGQLIGMSFALPRIGSAMAAIFVGSLGGSVSAAFGSNYARRRLQATGPYEITAGSFLAGGLLTLPLILVVPVPTVPAPADYGYLLLLGGVMSALAYTLYFRLVADLGATRAISVEFFVTAIAVVIGAVALHERLSVVQLGGGVAVIAACCLVLGLIPAARPP